MRNAECRLQSSETSNVGKRNLMKLMIKCVALLAVIGSLFGCQGQITWSSDRDIQKLIEGDLPVTSYSYKTRDGIHATCFVDDPNQRLDDADACRRALVRYSTFRKGPQPRVATRVAYATSASDFPIVVLWIIGANHGRWAIVESPKGKPWLPYAQSFLRDVMKEPQAAADLATAKEVSWSFTSSVVFTKAFGDLELPRCWFGVTEACGGPPSKDEKSFYLGEYQGWVDIRESSIERWSKLYELKYSKYEIPAIQNGITALKSKAHPDRSAYVVRKGDRVFCLFGNESPKKELRAELSKLADFFWERLKDK